ncbi:MAG: hypothetical protein R2712_13125 [Vicinamibacterales bacterium]
MRVFPRLPALAVAILSVAGTSAAPGPETLLSVPGASNQTPSAAALGNVVAVAWSAQAEGGKPDVYVAVSRDAGASFGTPVRVNAVAGEARVGGELPPRVGLVARGNGDPEIVVAYGAKAETTAIKLARSIDGGQTFSEGEALQAPGAPGDRGWHAMALDADGAAHVMWLDHRGLTTSKAGDHAGHEAEAMDGLAMALKSGLYYSRDGAPERELVKVCYCCKVAMAAGPGGALYTAWRQVYAGNIRDIAFLASTDGGRTFGEPTRVSEDDWHLAGCPDDGPAMSLSADGGVHIVWPTVIGGPEPEGAIFYAVSHDGRAFGRRVRVPTLGSPRPMHPQVLTSGGRVFAAWDEVIDGVRQAAVRTIAVDADGRLQAGAVERLGAAGNSSSYPVLIGATRGPLAIWVSGQPGACHTPRRYRILTRRLVAPPTVRQMTVYLGRRSGMSATT